MTTIRYFVPEDGDTEDHPNIFLMPKTQNSGFSPRLRDIKEKFPMRGTYHFRFKSPLIPGSDREKNSVAVWLDCVDDSQHVGVWRNTIVAKVTRINMDDDSDDDDDFAHHQTQPAANARIQPVANTRASRDPISRQVPAAKQTRIASNTNNNPHPPSRQPNPPAPAAGNLLGLDNHHQHHQAAPLSNGSLLDVDSPAPTASLLDMNGPAYHNTSAPASSSHDDFLGMTSTPVQSPAPSRPTSRTATSASAAQIPVTQAPSSYGAPRHNVSATGSRQQQQQPNKAFETFANKSGPFGGLEWK
mmetsp:Transcript_16309/g.19926  ORF Transcript_16309/g.19926 Transcript_16309/m.19926 type:complete len:301 (+) Transcript_16309:78-980(+)